MKPSLNSLKQTIKINKKKQRNEISKIYDTGN